MRSNSAQTRGEENQATARVISSTFEVLVALHGGKGGGLCPFPLRERKRFEVSMVRSTELQPVAGEKKHSRKEFEG